MFTFIVEFASLVLFIGCFWHAARYENSAFAQQWFIGAYLAAILRETILQTAFSVYFFAPSVLTIGAAPALLTLLSPSIFYLAYQFAVRFKPLVSSQDKIGQVSARWMLVLVFLISASIGLPLETTAVAARWWVYEAAGRVVLGAPVFASLIWGGSSFIFYVVFARIRRTPLPDRGKLYASIASAPVVAALQVIWILVVSLLG